MSQKPRIYAIHQRVIDPVTMQPLPESARTDGYEIPGWTIYWRRRLRDGDISLTPPAPAQETT